MYVCVCVRKVHDVSAQERLIHVLLHSVLLWHTLQCVLVYGVSHYIKSPMELYDVCIKDQLCVCACAPTHGCDFGI